MTTQKAPFWWRGTQEEWNAIPVGDRELLMGMLGQARALEAARLLAAIQGREYKPDHPASKTSAAVAEAPQVFLTGIRNWTEPVDGIPASRIRNCIIYMLDVLKDPWYRANCNNRAFVHRFAAKMNESTPEDYIFDPNAVLGSRRRHIDGENHPMIQIVVQKEQKDMTSKDRKELRDKYGVCDATVHYLAKIDCPDCYGKGFIEISDYPGDPLFEKLATAQPCHCLWE